MGGLRRHERVRGASVSDEAATRRAAMDTRATIEQAKGILMERYRVTPDQAFDVLTRASQQTGVKLRAVAQDLVRTGLLAGSV